MANVSSVASIINQIGGCKPVC